MIFMKEFYVGILNTAKVKSKSIALLLSFSVLVSMIVPLKSIAGTLTIGNPATAVSAANVCASSIKVPIMHLL